MKESRKEFLYFEKEIESSFSAGMTHSGGVVLGKEFDAGIEEGNAKESSQVFSSFPLLRPVGKGQSQEAIGTDYPPPFSRYTAGDESANRGNEGSPSLRIGYRDIQNVTQRDPKRPKERSKDKAYKQRFSMASDADLAGYGASFAFQGEPGRDHADVDPRTTPAPLKPGFVRRPGSSHSPLVIGGEGLFLAPPSNGGFEIFLVYSGTKIAHRVWDSMSIAQLAIEAASIFGLNPVEIILVPE